jgi:hypothetical protein
MIVGGGWVEGGGLESKNIIVWNSGLMVDVAESGDGNITWNIVAVQCSKPG